VSFAALVIELPVLTLVFMAVTSASGKVASFCARLEVFLLMPKSARVGASFSGGSILVPPEESRPRNTPAEPFALSVAFSISPNCLSASISMVCASETCSCACFLAIATRFCFFFFFILF
jgi:hypothetical protein